MNEEFQVIVLDIFPQTYRNSDQEVYKYSYSFVLNSIGLNEIQGSVLQHIIQYVVQLLYSTL